MAESSRKPRPTESGVVTKELLEKALAGRAKSLEVKDFDVSPGSEAGENFASIILKVKVNTIEDGQDNQRHLLVKTLPDDDKVKHVILTRAKTFQKESITYSQLFPALLELQKDGEHSVELPVPEYYYDQVDDTTAIIIMENVSARGYKLADARKGIDLEHCQVVMKELAKFHALSYALKVAHGIDGLKEKFPFLFVETLMSSFQRAMIEKVQTQITPVLVEVVSNATKRDDVKEKIAQFDATDSRDKMFSIVDNPEEPFATISHADFWANNIMFKYDAGGKPIAVKFVDFQATRYSTISRDINYFFYIGTTSSLRRNHMKDLIALYHSELHKNLAQLNVSFPELTLEKLQDLCSRTAWAAIGAASGFLFALFSSKDQWEDAPPVSQIAEGDLSDKFDAKAMAMISMNSPALQERVTGVIEDAVDLGLM